MSVGDLLTAALVPSGTDAVYALAEHLGDGSVDEFVAKMNDKAKELGLENTHFANPAGIDAPGNYSSAADLAKITREAMKYPEFREIVNMPEATISTQDREIDVVTTNLLVLPNSGYDYGPATGAKTGTSDQAGFCVVATAQSGDESYIAVVLDAQLGICNVSRQPRRRSSMASASTNTSLSSNAENLTRNWNCPTAGARR